jgi:hypothetical protein
LWKTAWKTVLYYDRFYSDAVMALSKVRMSFAASLHRLNPSSGMIAPGLLYEVGDDEIDYDTDGSAKTFAPSETFVGVNGKTEFTGDGFVYQLEGIVPTANLRGRAIAGSSFSRPMSIALMIRWDPEFYDSAVKLHQRCHFRSRNWIAMTKRICAGTFLSDSSGTFGLKDRISEAPSGYIYARGLNDVGRYNLVDPESFYRSCQIYQKPYEIESCRNHGEDQVRIKLTRRVSHYATWPAISSDPGAWNRDVKLAPNLIARMRMPCVITCFTSTAWSMDRSGIAPGGSMPLRIPQSRQKTANRGVPVSRAAISCAWCHRCTRMRTRSPSRPLTHVAWLIGSK